GVVDENIDRSERIDRGVDRGVDVGGPRDIAAHRNRLVADRRGGRARGLPIDVDDGNARALTREGCGNALAEGRCSAGAERNLVAERHATIPLMALPAGRPFDQPDLTP